MRAWPGTSGVNVSFSRVSVLKSFSSDIAAQYNFESPMLTREEFSRRFGARSVFAMVHLWPLPGALYRGSIDGVIGAALFDAQAIADGGADGLIMENFGSEENTESFTAADAAIVGTSIKRGGKVDAPVDRDRLDLIVRAFKSSAGR